MTQLAIKDVAERTGIAAGTIRMWEQRYGFPVPGRTAAGYRRYSEDDVEALRRIAVLRDRGLSVRAAIARASEEGDVNDQPSIFAAVAGTDPSIRAHLLRKATLVVLSRAIEHEALAQAAAPVVFGAFQRERFYRHAEPLYRRLAQHADGAAVFADFEAVRRPRGGPAEVPITCDQPLASEWAVIVDAPGYAACLLAWEQPGRGHEEDSDRRFETIWTIDPRVTRRAARVAASFVERVDPDLGGELGDLLVDRPLALEQPSPALTALTNRMIAYLEEPAGSPRRNGRDGRGLS